MNIRALVTTIAFLVAGSLTANAQNYVIAKSVIGNGGGPVSNGTYSMNMTIGQPLIGPASNGSMNLLQGFWYSTNSTQSVEYNPQAVAGLTLDQNYPNPFNPSTKIHFTLPERMKVTLRVMNLLGEEVGRVIDNETKDAGDYIVDFDAKDLPSGTYVYRLEANNTVLSKRMVLMK